MYAVVIGAYIVYIIRALLQSWSFQNWSGLGIDDILYYNKKKMHRAVPIHKTVPKLTFIQKMYLYLPPNFTVTYFFHLVRFIREYGGFLLCVKR